MADGDNKTLKVIESDVIPILEKIEANTRTRGYRRRTGGGADQQEVQRQARTYTPTEKAVVMADTPSVLSKRERVAKAERQAYLAQEKAVKAHRNARGQFTKGAGADSKSAEALQSRKERASAMSERRSWMQSLRGRFGQVAGMLPRGGGKNELGDAAGTAGAGVYWAALKEITDSVSELGETEDGIIGILKNKYRERKERNSSIASRANTEERQEQVQEQQRESLAEIADLLRGGRRQGRVVGGGGQGEGGGILDTVGDLIGGRGKGRLGKIAGGLGGMLKGAGGALMRAMPWVGGAAAAGAGGYAIGTGINQMLGKISGMLTGGKYEGEGWLGEAVFDLKEKISDLIGSVDKNTKALDDPSVGVNWGENHGVMARTGNWFAEKAQAVKRKITGEKVDPIAGSGELGALSARYESGAKGSSAVGYDSTGGTSYGKYQIASKTGTMNQFMDYLKENNPVAYDRLKAAGPADSGKDGKFAQEWKSLAAEGRLGNSEHDFIKATHFDPAFQGIENKGLRDKISSSKALQDVLWSTSVQHGGGGASKIMNKVYKEGMTDEELTNAIYAERGTKFGSSTASVQASVKNRFVDEKQRAIAMLAQEKNSNEAIAANQSASPSQVAQSNNAQVASASVQKQQPAQPVSARKEMASIESQQQGSDNSGVEKKLDKLIAINEQMSQNATKKEGDTDVQNNPQIPMEFDDANIVLMAHDRA